MDDRSQAYREMCIRYRINQELKQHGPELTPVQLGVIQDWIEYSRSNPQEQTLSILKDGNTKFRK